MGRIIDGNKDEVTKGGKMLIEMMNKKGMVIANNHEACKGRWTRVASKKGEEQRSIIDYVIYGKEQKDKLIEVEIDEVRMKTPYRIMREKEKVKVVYSDHNAITCTFKWGRNEEGKAKTTKRIMKKQKYHQFSQELKKRNGKDMGERKGGFLRKVCKMEW